LLPVAAPCPARHHATSRPNHAAQHSQRAFAHYHQSLIIAAPALPARGCSGWADLYYVPRALQPHFGALASSFAKREANAELAVPTMLRWLSSAASFDGGGNLPGTGAPAVASVEPVAAGEAGRVAELRCWGFCCSSAACPELLLRHMCGHRMDLYDDRMRHAFEGLWDSASSADRWKSAGPRLGPPGRGMEWTQPSASQ